MRFSECWLRELVDLPVKTEQLIEQITVLGMEVEKVDSVSGSCRDVLTGRILECSEVNLDGGGKLFVNRVDVGWERSLQIVCHDPLCCAGLNVIVAPAGVVLPGGETVSTVDAGDFPSEGKLCSFREIGVHRDGGSHRIARLPPDTPVGGSIADRVPFADNIFSVNIPPNRADLMSLIGIARDLAALNRTKHIPPRDHLKLILRFDRKVPPVKIQPSPICLRHLSRIISNPDLSAHTPSWMGERLKNCGIKPLDVVNDVASYVLLELGQPIQVLDGDLVEGDLSVGYTERDEELVLNGRSMKLPPKTLVVRDRVKILEVAGTATNDASRITSSTRNLLLHCTFFSPRTISRNVYLHGLNTEFSRRCVRGIDPDMLSAAIDRFTKLLTSICGGGVGPITECGSQEIGSLIIFLPRQVLRKMLGYPVPDENVRDALSRFGFGVESVTRGWRVLVPSWRFDINIPEDLVEEILRVCGYDHVPADPPRTGFRREDPDLPSVVPLKLAKNLLVNLGYQEIISYSLVNPRLQRLIEPHRKPVSLRNPASDSMSVMRTSLLTGLVETMIRNKNWQQRRIRLFESGLCFVPSEEKGRLADQVLTLSGIVTGSLHDRHWDLPSRSADFYDVKGDVEAILALTNRSRVTVFEECNHPALHPGQSANLRVEGELVGLVGVLHPKITDALDLRCSRVVVFELLWEKISKYIQARVRKIPPFPVNRRDVSVVVPIDTTAAEIVRECERSIAEKLIDVKLFDVFQGGGIPEDRKSVSISLTFQGESHTLDKREIEETVSECLASLERKFQAVPR